MPQIFKTPETVLTGAGSFQNLGALARNLGEHCLIVTGLHAMQTQGILEQAVQLLGAAGVRSTVCQGVTHDPSSTTVESIRELIESSACDMVLGLGGGSAIDAAKAAAAFAYSDASFDDVFNGSAMPAATLPILAIPSTFGTGTEATPAAVITHEGLGIKKGLKEWSMLPRVAIVDPLVGMHAPASVWMPSGMDALTQAIESYLSRHSFDLTEALSFHSIVLLHDGLRRCHENAEDVDAWSNCASGSLMAGIALANARLGIVHGLAHSVGAKYGITHGVACACLLPHVLRFNREAAPNKYALLGGILGGDPAEAMEAMLAAFEIPKTLPIQESDLSDMAVLALDSGSTKANPREVSEDDCIALLRQVSQ